LENLISTSSAELIGATRPFLFNSGLAARIACADSVFIVLLIAQMLSFEDAAVSRSLLGMRLRRSRMLCRTCTWTNITEMYPRQYLERNRDSFGRVELRTSARNCTMKEIDCWLPRKTQNQQATPGAQW
jgi:hypothetical protein